MEGKLDEAARCFSEAIEIDLRFADGWHNLGTALKKLGDQAGAFTALKNALVLDPTRAETYLNLGNLLIEADQFEVLHAQTALANPAVNDEAKALIGYGLAKYHDRRAEFREAAQTGVQANAARRRSRGPLDRAQLTARVQAIIDTYTTEFFAARRHFGVGTDQPVFIVGLPRSGTTLTEQILSAHPLLHGAGELPDLARIAACCVADGEESWQAATKLDEMKSRELAHRYLRALRDGAPKRQLRISDKSPLNFFQLAFAALLFPGARVVHCRRDARGNALSIWMGNFNREPWKVEDRGEKPAIALKGR